MTPRPDVVGLPAGVIAVAKQYVLVGTATHALELGLVRARANGTCRRRIGRRVLGWNRVSSSRERVVIAPHHDRKVVHGPEVDAARRTAYDVLHGGSGDAYANVALSQFNAAMGCLFEMPDSAPKSSTARCGIERITRCRDCGLQRTRDRNWIHEFSMCSNGELSAAPHEYRCVRRR